MLRFTDLRQSDRTCRTLSKEDLKLRCCQGPWQQQQQSTVGANGGLKNDGGSHHNYLRPTSQCVSKTDPTRCNSQYCKLISFSAVCHSRLQRDIVKFSPELFSVSSICLLARQAGLFGAYDRAHQSRRNDTISYARRRH